MLFSSYEVKMFLSFKKLWKLLIDKNMKKKDLISQTGISKSTLSKLTHGKNVNSEVLLKICIALNCDISDIVEIEKRG